MFETSERFLLDTHVWVWLIEGSPRLNSAAVKELDHLQRSGRLYASVISAWEIGLLNSLGRLSLSVDVGAWLRASVEPDRIQLQPLALAAAVEANELPGDIHRDPADRIIVATARVHGFMLLTRDEILLDYAKQGHLRARRI